MAAAAAKYLYVLATICISVTSSVAAQCTNDTNHHNSTVKCDSDQFHHANKETCIQCRICKPGYGEVCPCTAISNTDCRKCPNGTFSKWNGNNRFCIGCRKCEGYIRIRRRCNATSDTLCSVKLTTGPPTIRNSHITYIWIIVSLSVVLIFVIVGLTLTICLMKKRRREQEEERRRLEPEHRETDASLASEALLYDGSSFSSLEDSRWRRGGGGRFKNDADSVQSSLLSSDNHSGSDRCSVKTLKHPEILISSLPASVFQGLGRRMNPTQQYRDWKTLAGRLRRTQMDIEHIRMRDDHDYTEKLLLEWQTSDPDATIGMLFNHLVEMRREDAASVLYEYDKQSAQRVETPV